MGDIVALQSATGLIGIIGLHQFTLATHRLLTVLPCVVEVRQIDAYTDGSTRDTDSRSLQETGHLLLTDSLHEPSYHHEQNDKQIIIGHLYMVCIDLKSREYSCQQQSPQVLSPIGQYDTRNHRRQISQGPHLPDMACGNNNKEIGGESPDDTAKGCQMLTEVEGSQQDVEAQQIGKDEPHIFRQPQVIGVDRLCQQIGRAIRWCHLVGRHSAEEGIRPTATFTCFLQIFDTFLSCAAPR